MHNIIVISELSTLRGTLRERFADTPYELIEIDSYASAIKDLRHIHLYDGIIVSWSNTSDTEFSKLIGYLSREKFDPISTIVISDSDNSDAATWTHDRPNCAWMKNERLDDIAETFSRLQNENSSVTSILEAFKESNAPTRILFVDSTRSSREYYQKLLEKNGYIASTADSVTHAWEILSDDTPLTFDIVICEFYLPDHEADELCKRIMADTSMQIMSLAVTSDIYLEDVVRRAFDAGATECIIKDEGDDLFLARINAMSRTARALRFNTLERHRLADILSLLGEGVYGIDSSERINFINPSAVHILGYTSTDSFIGKRADKVLYNRKAIKSSSALHEAYHGKEKLRDWRTQFIKQDQQLVPVSCTVAPMTIAGKNTGAIVAFRDITKQLQLEKQLRWQATRDALTKLYNRRYFEEQLEIECKRLERSESTSALIYLDLDRFKYINDTAGHETGDKVLLLVSEHLKNRVRTPDILARLGGDEFAILLRDIDANTIEEMANQYRNALSHLRFTSGGVDIKVHGSIGVTLIDQNNHSSSDAMACADIACHQAKSEGRDLIRIYNPQDDARTEISSDMEWANRLSEALENNRFRLFFQPILAVKDIDFNALPEGDETIWSLHKLHRDRPVYVESLLRLPTGKGDFIDPNIFLPSAERFGLMPEIDLWVMRYTLDILQKAHDQELYYNIGINISALTLADLNTLGKLIAMIHEKRDLAKHIIIEITERSAITNMTNAQKFINKAKSYGCLLSLDDFGAGFSSFSQLRELPVDYVKIDGQFVKNMDIDIADRTVVNAINDIAHSIGRHSIAEYVESAQVLKSLLMCDVDYVQGYYISKPLTHKELLKLHQNEPTFELDVKKHNLGKPSRKKPIPPVEGVEP